MLLYFVGSFRITFGIENESHAVFYPCLTLIHFLLCCEFALESLLAKAGRFFGNDLQLVLQTIKALLEVGAFHAVCFEMDSLLSTE